MCAVATAPVLALVDSDGHERTASRLDRSKECPSEYNGGQAGGPHRLPRIRPCRQCSSRGALDCVVDDGQAATGSGRSYPRPGVPCSRRVRDRSDCCRAASDNDDHHRGDVLHPKPPLLCDFRCHRPAARDHLPVVGARICGSRLLLEGYGIVRSYRSSGRSALLVPGGAEFWRLAQTLSVHRACAVRILSAKAEKTPANR